MPAAAIIRQVIPERFRPIGYLTHLTRRRTLCRVRSGPFAGMRYGVASVGSAYIPKLLGIYERELSEIINVACSQQHRVIIDIGAAEGYYAVGLALRNPSSKVIAFESDTLGRRALRHISHLNGVEARIDVRGECRACDLESVIADNISPLVICDVEGNEEHLLNPAVVPSLCTATMLVEMHDFVCPGITMLLQERFESTHHIRHVDQEPRSRGEFPWRTPYTALLPHSYVDWALSEWRPVQMSWLWMVPRARR